MKRFGLRHRSRSLVLFPTEVWQHIFSFACTDNGYTGRSLERVSKSFKALSHPFKFQSLALEGLCQVAAFAAIVTKSSPSVLYLFVCDSAESTIKWECSTGVISGSFLSQIFKRKAENGSVLDSSRSMVTRRVDISQEISFILSSIAHNLRLLSIVIDTDTPTIPHLSFPAFPSLVELVIRTNHYAAIDLTPALESIPLLQRLALIGQVDSKGLNSEVLNAAPHLTHLMLPEAGYDLVLAGIDRIDEVNEHGHFLCLPDNVQKLIIQPAIPPVRAYCGTMMNLYIKELSYAQWIARKDRRVVLLKAPSYKGETTSGCEQVRKGWISRISGRSGTWSESERDESIADYPVEEGDRYWQRKEPIDPAIWPWPQPPPPTWDRNSDNGYVLAPFTLRHMTLRTISHTQHSEYMLNFGWPR